MANRKALVVAINDYPGDGNDLPSCVEDAKGFTELLQFYGFQDIRTLLDGEATIKAVTDGLGWLLGGTGQAGAGAATPDDRLVLYYSGHGFRTERDGVLRECLCLQDGFFFDDELSKQTQGLQPGTFTVVLDSCHSGGMDKRFFETLAAAKGAEGSAERVRVKTWIPEAGELVKLFAKEDKSIPFKPFGCAPIAPRRAKSANGTAQYAGVAAKVKQAKKSAEAQVNGLMITACQADQTASASSSQTQGRSAFTFCLLNAVQKLSSDPASVDGVPASTLFDAVAQDLAAHQFKQTPVLVEPPNAPGLRARSFLTLQPTQQAAAGAPQAAQATAPAQPEAGAAQPAPDAAPSAPPATPDAGQPAASASNGASSGPGGPGGPSGPGKGFKPSRPSTGAKPGAPTQAAAAQAPATGSQPSTTQPSSTNGEQPSSTLQAQPSSTNGEQQPSSGVQPPSGTQPSSGTQPPSGAQPSSGTQPASGTQPPSGAQPSFGTQPASGMQPSPGTPPSSGAQPPPSAAQPPPSAAQPSLANPSRVAEQGEQAMDNQSAASMNEDSEAKILRAILPAILPGILQYRTKAFQSGAGAGNGQEALQDEKFWGPVVAAAITAAPGIYRAVRGRRKDFEPEPVAAQAAPPADDKVWGMAIAAAISAAPSIYRAVRGKDFELAPGATPQGPAPQPPVGAPRAGIAVGEPSGGPTQGLDDKTWGQVIAAAITAAPNIYRAVRGKDFESDATAASSQAPVVDEKVMRILPAILPGIVHAMQQRKDFEPEGKAVTAPPPAMPAGDDKIWGMAIAAAITAAPQIYRAVRGKEFELT